MWLAATILDSTDLDKGWVIESLNARPSELDFILHEMGNKLRLWGWLQGAGIVAGRQVGGGCGDSGSNEEDQNWGSASGDEKEVMDKGEIKEVK